MFVTTPAGLRLLVLGRLLSTSVSSAGIAARLRKLFATIAGVGGEVVAGDEDATPKAVVLEVERVETIFATGEREPGTCVRM
jgi:hypothetical protein